LRIETYFQRIREILENSPIVSTFDITYDKRGTHTGFIRGQAYLADGSVLHLREFVDVEVTVERLAYAYQYMDSAQTIVFRYDNAGHHRKLNLPTYPHHKHAGSAGNVVPSEAPDLATVLNEVGTHIKLP
jgi:hypothetical protein